MGRILSVRTVVFIGGGKTMMMIIDEFKCFPNFHCVLQFL